MVVPSYSDSQIIVLHGFSSSVVSVEEQKQPLEDNGLKEPDKKYYPNCQHIEIQILCATVYATNNNFLLSNSWLFLH